MKTTWFVLSAVLAVLTLGADPADKFPKQTTLVNPPPPVVTAPPTPLASPVVYVYDQKPIGGRPPLVSPEQARAVVERFKAGYPKMGAPRFVVFVNRGLGDEINVLKQPPGAAPVESAKTDPASPGGDPGSAGKGERPLADRQTMRDIERLAGRPLRLAGAKLMDERIAAETIGDRQVQEFLAAKTPAAARDRDVLTNNADVVIEFLMSSRPITYAGLAQDVTYAVPDIQATAIRLSNAQVLGQASTRDIMGPDGSAQRIVRSYDIHEITEAVALALMEDMMQSVQ